MIEEQHKKLRIDEFPPGAAEWEDSLSRRNFLKLAGATLALSGLTACTKQPVQQILPYVNQPENLVPGEPLFYATAMTLGGFATGALVKSIDGRPVKIEGNPEHPDTLGGSSVWQQASILDLYNPDRSQAVMRKGIPTTWGAFVFELHSLMNQQAARSGSGLRILSETISSPTLVAQIRQLLSKFPGAKWHQYEPINRDNVHEGARLAFGEVVETDYRFDEAEVIVALDSDFLYTHPGRLRYSRQFARGRKIAEGAKRFRRLYAAESTPSITGSMANHRLPIESFEIENLARRIASELGLEIAAGAPGKPGTVDQWLKLVLPELKKNRGRSIVIAGEWQPAIVHALAHWINEHLDNVGKTVFYQEGAEAHAINQGESIRELVADLNSETIDSLIVLGGNPVHNAPADLDFAGALRKAKTSIHLGLEYNETAAECVWHVPESHYLETWSDARSFDGTASIIQPLIAPLYDTRSAHDLLEACLNPALPKTDYDLVREFWQKQNLWPDFERGLRNALHDGLIKGSEWKRKEVRVRASEIASAAAGANAAEPGSQVEIVFRPDPNLWDGRFVSNGWLLECPNPLNKISWGNAVLISAALARRHRIQNGDVVELRLERRTVKGPAWIMPGQAENSVTVHLGYGRSLAGTAGQGTGFDAYPIRTSQGLWSGTGLALVKTGAVEAVVSTQKHHQMDSPERQIYRTAKAEQSGSARSPDATVFSESVEAPKKNETLYDEHEFRYQGYRWGMSIDLNTCIGCNACLLACEVENNIPVVGKDQISRGRDMFWIRVDTYHEGDPDNPQFNHMPVPCMHCEHAPCELVCPVEATVHDHEGLNVQVYNRCVGTRFCSNNCPYKVRRFNFFQYAKYHAPSLAPMYNPDVTVRWRGVMEKCTYCVQRISRARITAEKENRRIRDGEVVTACQQACPADAIVFGDLNDPNSRVARLKQSSLNYSMLGQLNTRPRTTYLAKVVSYG